MIKTQIKSILRNRVNKLYIIVFFILFTILNFSLNLGNIIDRYYDEKVKDFLQENAEIAEKYEYGKTYEECEEWFRTVQITSNNGELSKDEINKIKVIKNVEDFKIRVCEYSQLDIIIQTKCVIVDDWRNCTYVEKQLDKMGYTVYTDNQFIEEYMTVRTYSDLVSELILIVVITIFIICYKNILNNEKENIELLSIMGYTKNQIRIIKANSLIVLTLIGYIAGSIIYGIVLFILK